MADAHSPFHDLDDYVAIPRMTGLRLSPDGSWLAATVQSLSPDKKKYVTSIWRIDTAGGPAARLTRSADGEGSPRFLPDGTLLFVSKRTVDAHLEHILAKLGYVSRVQIAALVTREQ